MFLEIESPLSTTGSLGYIALLRACKPCMGDGRTEMVLKMDRYEHSIHVRFSEHLYTSE